MKAVNFKSSQYRGMQYTPEEIAQKVQELEHEHFPFGYWKTDVTNNLYLGIQHTKYIYIRMALPAETWPRRLAA